MDRVEFGVASRNYFNMPAWVALHQGFFVREGLQVVPQVVEHIDETDEYLRNGSIKIAYQATEQVLVAVDAGEPLILIGGNIRKLPFTFIARPEVKDIAGLRGRVIGVSSLGSGTSSILRNFLEKKDLRYQKDYKMRAVGPIAARWELLQSGEIDAGLQGIPMNYVALEAGFIDLGDYGMGEGSLEFASVATNTEWASKNRDVVVRFMRALGSAHSWIYGNRFAALEIAFQETGIPTEHLNRAWDDYTGREIFSRDGQVDIEGLDNLLRITAAVRSLARRKTRPATDYVDSSFYDEAFST